MTLRRSLAALLLWGALVLMGCAKDFPRPQATSTLGPTGPQLFDETYYAHGGARLEQLRDVNVSLDGDWKFLITRIQPLVTDHKYRVRSEERLLPQQGVYATRYTGPAGTKKVFRTRDQIQVFYNEESSADADVLASTALTADAFYLFTLGPLALAGQRNRFLRLEDQMEAGRRYHRIYAEIEPGFGQSTQDELVLWIDAETKRTFRVHLTLEGYETTRGAHVDVTYLGYRRLEDYVFPVRFSERVRAPVAIKAHEWHYTGIDINRGYVLDDLRGPVWQGDAMRDAEALPVIGRSGESP